MTHWAQLLHFYQPPTQTHDVLRKVADESYRPLLKVLRQHKNARIAVNIQGVLTDLLLEHGLGDVVQSLKELAERGQVEFVGSGKYHPILPLIPEHQRSRSIAENHKTNASAFGEAWRPRGFFPPEMCFSMEVTPAIRASGQEWFAMSGVGCPAEWPIDRIYRVPAGDSNLAVLFRDDSRSNQISFAQTDPESFLNELSGIGGEADAYTFTAMDAETFGHHITDWEQNFLGGIFALLAERQRAGTTHIQMVLPSELLSLYPAGETIEPHPSSWSTSAEDLAENNPFPLWNAPGNTLHDQQWEYVDHCLHLVGAAQRHATTPEARKFADYAAERLEPGLHSCQFWWASRRPMWDVTMVHRGFLILNEVLLNASRSIAASSASDRTKSEARWRAAAAAEIRLAIERELVLGSAP